MFDAHDRAFAFFRGTWERTPGGGWQWASSSVEHLLDHARRLGLTVHEPADG